MMDNGKMIKQMVLVCLFTSRLELDMKDIGRMTCNMAQAYRFIVTGTDMKGCLNKERETEKGLIIMLLVRYIKAVGLMEELKDSEFVHGLMGRSMKVNGWIIRNMDKGYTHGLMEGSMKETIETIKNMAMEHTHGLTIENISDNGRTIKDTAGAPMSSIVSYQKRGFGRKTRE